MSEAASALTVEREVLVNNAVRRSKKGEHVGNEVAFVTTQLCLPVLRTETAEEGRGVTVLSSNCHYGGGMDGP